MKKDITPKQNTQKIKQDQQEAELLDEQSKSQELMKASENAQIVGQAEKSALANQLFGRLQLAGAMSKMLNTSTLLDLKKVKEEKLYLNFKGVPVISSTGEMLNVSTWRDFCLSLGLSRQHVDDQLINISAFGAEAYEAMRYAGIGVHTMRGIRKLPENDMSIVVNDVEANVGDKDAIIELIEDITVKHSKEKVDLQKQLDEAQANKEASDKFLQAKEQKINELEKVVNKCLTPDEQRQHHLDQEQVLKDELSLIEAECTLAIDKLDLAIGKIYNHPKCSEELEQMPHKLYEYLLKHLIGVADQYQMKFDANQILDPIMFNLPV